MKTKIVKKGLGGTLSKGAKSVKDYGDKVITRLGGKSTSGTPDEAILKRESGYNRARATGTAAGVLGALGLASALDGDDSESEYKGKVYESTTKQRGDLPKEKPKAKAKSKPYLARTTEPKTELRVSEPDSGSKSTSYTGSGDDIHPETSSISYSDKKEAQTPFSDRPIDEYKGMGKYAKGGTVGRGMGAATRGGGAVMKRAGGGKVMSRGAALRGFGKEIK